MLNCKEVTWAIASEEYADAGWLYRLKVRFHLFMCRHCHCYEGQIEGLGDTARQLRQELRHEQCDEDECLARLEGKILDHIDCRKVESESP